MCIRDRRYAITEVGVARHLLDAEDVLQPEAELIYYAVCAVQHLSLIHIFLACTGAYIIGICLYCTTQGRTRDGEEHGSAQWASPKQVNAMFCQKQKMCIRDRSLCG